MFTLAGMPVPSTDLESIESVLERVDTYLTALNDPDRPDDEED